MNIRKFLSSHTNEIEAEYNDKIAKLSSNKPVSRELEYKVASIVIDKVIMDCARKDYEAMITTMKNIQDTILDRLIKNKGNNDIQEFCSVDINTDTSYKVRYGYIIKYIVNMSIEQLVGKKVLNPNFKVRSNYRRTNYYKEIRKNVLDKNEGFTYVSVLMANAIGVEYTELTLEVYNNAIITDGENGLDFDKIII